MIIYTGMNYEGENKMKNRFATGTLLAFTATLLVACGNAENTVDTTIETTISEETEAPHEHVYKEEVMTPATCLEGGESTFKCECGDSYTEATSATGHDFSNYVSNEDATYTADGTETATCACGEKDTRVAVGSMLTYSFEEMDATKYAKSTVNVRSLPTSDSEKLGGLSVNDEVKITGKCNENGWYRIEYSDGIAYVSDEYLVDEKVEGQTGASGSGTKKSGKMTAQEAYAYAVSLGYPIYQAVDNGDGTATYYYLNINEVLPDDQSDFIGDNYVAVRDVAFAITEKYTNDFYAKETSGHYATLDDAWTVRWRTVRRVPNL